MTSTDSPQQVISSEQVSEYLLANPNFLLEHPDLLSKLQLNHASGEAISLIEHQVARLREQNAKLEHKLENLFRVAHDNQRLIDYMQQLAQALVDCTNLQAVIDTVFTVLSEQFDIEFITLSAPCGSQILQHSSQIGSINSAELDEFLQNFIKQRRPQCARLQAQQLDTLFQDDANAIKSQALVPIYHGDEVAILALGSSDSARFHPGMGIFYLQQLSALVSHAVNKFLT